MYVFFVNNKKLSEIQFFLSVLIVQDFAYIYLYKINQ